MNNLGGLARSINIGDLAVSTFANLALKEGLGQGIFQDTSIKGYRWWNFTKNYKYLQSYNSIRNKIKSTGSKRYFFGDLHDAPNKDGLGIGWAYTTDINDYFFNTGYSSSGDFDEFQNLLRERALFHSPEEDAYKNRFFLNGNTSAKFESKGLKNKVNRGDLYSISEEYEIELPQNKATLSINNIPHYIINGGFNLYHDWLGNGYYDNFNGIEPLKEVYSGDFNIGPAEDYRRRIIKKHKIVAAPIEFIENFKRKNIPSNYVIAQYGNYDTRSNSDGKPKTPDFLVATNYFKPVKINQDIKNLKSFINPYILSDGLWLYYANYAAFNINNNKLYKHNKAYGVENDEAVKYYTISEENKLSGTTPITKYNEGGLTSFNTQTQKSSHIYYQEPDGNNKSVNKIEGSTTSDGFVVSLSDFNGDNISKLISKTNDLFTKGKIGSLINRFHTDKQEYNELITSHDAKYGISRGRNLLREKPNDGNYNESSYDNPYCRVWTAHHQYNRLKHLIRPFSEDGGMKSPGELQETLGKDLRPNGGKHFDKYSVLMDNGFVRISPSLDDVMENSGTPIQNYMFSIENLAYKDANKTLTKEQLGPNGGRIMWFPPYNLKFSENVNVNWNPNNFIGRGEQIYTYTNTERSGTLDFTLLIDHPSMLNKWRGTSSEVDDKEKREQEILRFFAGCSEFGPDITPLNTEVESEKDKALVKTDNRNTEPVYQMKDIAFVVFFPNDFSCNDIKDIDSAIEKLQLYEYGSGNDVFTERDKSFQKEILLNKNNTNTNSGLLLNKFSKDSEAEKIIRKTIFNGNEEIEIRSFKDLLAIKDEIIGGKIFGRPKETIKLHSITTQGFASDHGYHTNNMALCERRRNFIERVIREKCGVNQTETPFGPVKGREIKVNNIDGRGDVNQVDAKVARAALAVFHLMWKDDVTTINTPNDGTTSVNGADLTPLELVGDRKASSDVSTTTITEKPREGVYSHDNEYLYFSKLSDESYMVHRYIVDKVRYFDPAFHSITPEGFNSRLTFLHQCTRQGPTTSVNTGQVDEKSKAYLRYAGNLSFGRAPYCILRIGDFFNTKICIESLSIQYDNGGGVQWDINPEGAGVQPMYANISITFKFLGGQDIAKPIEKLQNAITSNYYANASVYDKNADTIKVE